MSVRGTDGDGEEVHQWPCRPATGIYLLGVGLVIMLAGLLFGYDQGVISGALGGIQKSFSVGTLLLEVITSWVTLGAMAGALVAGALADRIGRRLTIVAAACCSWPGPWWSPWPPGPTSWWSDGYWSASGWAWPRWPPPCTPPRWPPPGSGAGWSRSTSWPSPSGSSSPTSPTTS